MKLDNFATKYSAGRLLLVLAFSVLACKLLITYLFLWFPKLHSTDIPLLCSAILIILLSPILYTSFYRPMVKEFEILKRAEVRMRDFAFNDMLTGVYNRRGFLIFAEQLLKLSNRAQRGLILIYADMDNLKLMNDGHGHEEGDRALVCIADVLKKTFRSSDVIGRVGGDEFAILALEAEAESLDVLYKRLKLNLERTKYNVDSIHKLTFSLGLLYYNPQNPQVIEELLKRADMLMYEEKRYSKIAPEREGNHAGHIEEKIQV